MRRSSPSSASLRTHSDANPARLQATITQLASQMAASIACSNRSPATISRSHQTDQPSSSRPRNQPSDARAVFVRVADEDICHARIRRRSCVEHKRPLIPKQTPTQQLVCEMLGSSHWVGRHLDRDGQQTRSLPQLMGTFGWADSLGWARNRCTLRCPIYRHAPSLNVIYGGKNPLLNICFGHPESCWITKSVH